MAASLAEPGAAVTNVSASQVSGNPRPVARISWSPLVAEHWNGIPFGYAVSNGVSETTATFTCMYCKNFLKYVCVTLHAHTPN